jgi:hypothetical protein
MTDPFISELNDRFTNIPEKDLTKVPSWLRNLSYQRPNSGNNESGSLEYDVPSHSEDFDTDSRTGTEGFTNQSFKSVNLEWDRMNYDLDRNLRITARKFDSNGLKVLVFSMPNITIKILNQSQLLSSKQQEVESNLTEVPWTVAGVMSMASFSSPISSENPMLQIDIYASQLCLGASLQVSILY